MKNVALLLIAVASSAAISAEPKQALPQQIQPQKAEVGRYVPVSPPASGDKSYANFLWVLDTATGSLNAYRVAHLNEDKSSGRPEGWIIENILHEWQYISLWQQQQGKQKQ